MIPYMVSSQYDGCYYCRQYLPMKYNYWSGDYLELNKKRTDVSKAYDIRLSDVIVFHRLDDPVKCEMRDKLQADGKKIVVDNDDTTLIDEVGSMSAYMEYQGLVHDSIKKADLVTCSTEFLKKEYSNYTKAPIVVLPNCIDPNDYPKHIENHNKKVRIGFIGSVMYKEDRSSIEDLIIELADRDDVEIVCLGMLPPESRNHTNIRSYTAMKQDCDFWDTIKCEWHSWVPISQYITKLNELNLDMMVMARKDNYFNRCKSNIKYLEASMLEIPCVCQSFKDGKSPYDKDITDGWNGYLAEDQDEFKNRIEELIRYKDKRKAIGKNAKEYVLKNYNIRDKAHLWEEAYRQIK